VNTHAKQRNDLKIEIARKSFSGATLETIHKIFKPRENPLFHFESSAFDQTQPPFLLIEKPLNTRTEVSRAPDGRNYGHVPCRSKKKPPEPTPGKITTIFVLADLI
jgi:hypothetical protein